MLALSACNDAMMRHAFVPYIFLYTGAQHGQVLRVNDYDWSMDVDTPITGLYI